MYTHSISSDTLHTRQLYAQCNMFSIVHKIHHRFDMFDSKAIQLKLKEKKNEKKKKKGKETVRKLCETVRKECIIRSNKSRECTKLIV